MSLLCTAQTVWNEDLKKHCFVILAMGVLWVGEHVCHQQLGKKVVSDSAGLVDFAISLVIFVLDLPNTSAVFWGNSNYRRIVTNPANQKDFGAS